MRGTWEKVFTKGSNVCLTSCWERWAGGSPDELDEGDTFDACRDSSYNEEQVQEDE